MIPLHHSPGQGLRRQRTINLFGPPFFAATQLLQPDDSLHKCLLEPLVDDLLYRIAQSCDRPESFSLHKRPIMSAKTRKSALIKSLFWF
jgi:hypothetical protein